MKVHHVICEREFSGSHKCSVYDYVAHVIGGKHSQDNEGFRKKIICNFWVKEET